MSNPITRSAWRTLAVMVALIAALALAVFGSVQYAGGQWTPKLGLDLEGGTQMILEPQVGEGQQINEQQMAQAVDIIRARVDGQGVAEAEVATLGRNVVVAVPGAMTRQQEEALRQSSQMRFRPVLAAIPVSPPQQPTPTATGTPKPGATSPVAKPGATPSAKVTGTGRPTATSTKNAVAPAALERPAATTPPAPATPAPNPTDLLKTPKQAEVAPGLPALTEQQKADPQKLVEYATNEAWLTSPQLAQQFQALDCTADRSTAKDDPALATVACDSEGLYKYVLGPAVINGDQLADAGSGPRTNQQGQPMPGFQVTLNMAPGAVDTYRTVSQHMLGLQQPRNQLAMVLDGRVISAPYFESAILDGTARIDGNFDANGAKLLADQLKFGALPMSFAVQSSEQISPTVGGDQLHLGIVGGLIGLGLVVLYFLWQYRVLGLVTTASLVIVALITYLVIVLFGWRYNLRLTLAGVTGAIIAIGTTADSFIVYFERVRDEVRDGRPVPSAVETGWRRARRTIVISAAVNFLAALVLYILAASNVRGFAFMLMLTTVIDLVVTFLFTHPMLTLLTGTKFIGGGHPWSGLNPRNLGAHNRRYVGRGRVVSDPGIAPSAAESLDVTQEDAR